ncbi:fibronectin type III domain protein [Bacillus sp. UMTAT18]|uniref:fibronectin type III domain-containing protein n=1 Tax=Bacillus sp. UMTAT18 TaxID=1565146 RepID=UPI00061873BB|nr:fibronectin type III domain-containing protein [Bacillus sp. UMTAT18]KKC52163.1 fibronectin type III domain protein [Bacillus sp. UMTAT18]
MKIKKCGFLLSLAMLICLAIPSLASANTFDSAILSVRNGYIWSFCEPSKCPSPNIRSGETQYYKIDESFSLGVNEFKLGVRNNGGSLDTSVISFYTQSKKLIKSFPLLNYSFDDLVSYRLDEINDVKYFSITNNTGFNLSVSRLSFGGGSNPPVKFPFVYEDVQELNAMADIDKIKLTWKNPTDPKFTGVRLFFEGEEIKLVNPKETNFVSVGLKSDTNYKYKIVSLYGDKSSQGVEKIFRTKKPPMPLVKPPDNVFITPQDKKMVIAWDDVKSPYLEGYNVYIDGKKINDKPLTSSKLVLKNLENGKSYKVQISAVNKENAEGEKSKEKEDKPSSDALEVEYDVKMPFSPLDLITSSFSLLAILGGFILLMLAIIWFKSLKKLIVKAVRREKDKK